MSGPSPCRYISLMGPETAPLRIALLGIDGTTACVVRAILQSKRFELVGACEAEDCSDHAAAEMFRPFLGRLRLLDAWESLLDTEQIDAVVVARAADEDRRAEQLRKLIQAGTPLLASHPVFDSMLVYYELDMIRRETDCTVLPYLPLRHHPALQQLAEIARQGVGSPIGKVEQIVVQRCITQPTKVGVVSQFARDVDLIRSIVGDLTRLGGMAGAGPDGGYSGLGLQMSGPSGVVARWSVDPIESAEGASVSLLGAGGKAVVSISADDAPWTLDLTVTGSTSRQEFPGWDPAATALDQFEAAIEGRLATPDWVDASRSVELAETIDRSLKKSRTIELYYEDYTEEGTFKGTMTSLGCGLLLLGMFLLAVVGIAEQMGVPFLRGWPYLLLGAMGHFSGDASAAARIAKTRDHTSG